MNVVVVESPAKAKTINKYLGSDYTVLASYGHIRDLPSKAAEIPDNLKKQPWARLGVDVDHDGCRGEELAQATREGGGDYVAWCTSTYRRLEHEVWKVVQHQQTVPPVAG